jgi:hypothetical protein
MSPDERNAVAQKIEEAAKAYNLNLPGLGELLLQDARAMLYAPAPKLAPVDWTYLNQTTSDLTLPAINQPVELYSENERSIAVLERDDDPVDGGLYWAFQNGDTRELLHYTHWRPATPEPVKVA